MEQILIIKTKMILKKKMKIMVKNPKMLRMIMIIIITLKMILKKVILKKMTPKKMTPKKMILKKMILKRMIVIQKKQMMQKRMKMNVLCLEKYYNIKLINNLLIVIIYI